MMKALPQAGLGDYERLHSGLRGLLCMRRGIDPTLRQYCGSDNLQPKLFLPCNASAAL